MDGFKKAKKEGKDIISLSDTTIDTSPNAGSGHKFYSTKVEKEFFKLIEENDHFIKKVKDIHKEIQITDTDPLVILEKLITRVKKEAKFPLIKLEETKKIIKE